MDFIISETFREILKNLNNKISKALLELSEHDELSYIGLAADVKGNISYLTKDKIDNLNLFLDDYWDAKKRIICKPSKFIEKIFPETYNDHDKQKFTNALKIALSLNTDKMGECFKIVEGEELRKYYHYETYAEEDECGNTSEGDHPLKNSCMRYEKCQEFLDLYAKNPHQCKMGILLNEENKLRARVLLWEGKWHDRIYHIGMDSYREMCAIMENKNYINISDKNDGISCNCDSLEIKLDVGEGELEYYPYVDTLTHIDGNIINNCDNGYLMQDTDGSYEGRETVCDNCSCTGDLEALGDESRYPGHMYCEDCRVYSDRYECYITEGEAVYCEDNSEYILERDSVRLYNGNIAHENDVTELYNGKYALDGDVELCSTEEDEWFIAGDENFIEIDGDFYNIDSDKIEEIDGEYYIKGSSEHSEALLIVQQEN